MIGNVYVLLDDKGRTVYPKTFYQDDVAGFQKANKEGWGVYRSVNDFKATDEERKVQVKDGTTKMITKRNIKFLTKINAVFADIDIGKKGDGQTREQKETKKEKLILEITMKCPPSFIIVTSNGIQPIWKLVNSSTDIKYQAMYLNVINGIIEWSKTIGGAGDAVKDVTRILRVPGYYHMKEEPFMVYKIQETGQEYEIEELEKEFKERIPVPKPIQTLVGKEDFSKQLSYQYQEVEKLDFVDVVTKAFNSRGRSCDIDSQGRLIVDGRLTGTFIGKRDDRRYLASTSHEPFKGNMVTAVSDILCVSNKEAYKWILDNFNIKQESEIRKEVKAVEHKEELKESVKTNFKHISYAEKVMAGYQELFDTDPDKIMKRGWDERDNLLGGIYGGKIYLIGANTGIGKSTFINQVCRNVGKAGNRVVKYSLEDRMEDSAKEEIFYEVNRLRFREKKPLYPWVKFVNNEYRDDEFKTYVNRALELLVKENIIELEKNKQVNIDELILLMEDECKKGTKLFAIDHLHYFEWSSDNRERLDLHIQNVMHNLNEIARKHNVAILLVAHYRNNTSLKVGESPDPSRFKDAASIKQVANIIIQIERTFESDTSYFYITKLRGPIKPDILDTGFDLSTYQYTFTKSRLQIQKEQSFIE